MAFTRVGVIFFALWKLRTIKKNDRMMCALFCVMVLVELN